MQNADESCLAGSNAAKASFADAVRGREAVSQGWLNEDTGTHVPLISGAASAAGSGPEKMAARQLINPDSMRALMSRCLLSSNVHVIPVCPLK